MAKRNTSLSQFGYIRLVHSLFSADLLNRVLTGAQPKCGKSPSDFNLRPGLSVSDEMARAGRIATSAYALAEEQGMSPEAVTAYVKNVLTGSFDYQYTDCPACGILPDPPEETRGLLPGFADALATPEPEDLYPITALLSPRSLELGIPFLLVPAGQDLDKNYVFPDGRKKTPFLLMQEYLDRSDRFLWAIVTNGSDWRIMRDSTTVTLSTYLDIDMETVLSVKNMEAFAAVYRLMHASRVHREISSDPETCLWERWRKELEQGGERVRDGLKGRVQAALSRLGTGFLAHRANEALRAAVASGELTPMGLYNELLRLVYRFIFIFVMEERDLLHAHLRWSTEEKENYRKGYSMARLVDRAQQNHDHDRYDDIWQSIQVVFSALGNDGGEPRLALPALGGLFDADQCPHLDGASLPNRTVYEVMKLLRWSNNAQDGALLRIDYCNMGSEELGSVYEELLELTPQINLDARHFGFTTDTENAAGARGNKRKTTGSYYTPPCLVELLVHSALDPLIQERRAAAEPGEAREALLSLRIIDPACGSGHFLLSAARHLAQAVAEVSGDEPELAFPKAMHDVIDKCIYGVDLNPMAVELVRMNLWLEGYMPGKPLGFLDDHLICGNSLLGILKQEMLFDFIPKEAYKAVPGDDKTICKAAAAANRSSIKTLHEHASVLDGFILQQEDYYPHPAQGSLPSDVHRQTEDYKVKHEEMLLSPDALAADAFIGAFILPKTDLSQLPDTSTVRDCRKQLAGLSHQNVAAAHRVCRENKVLHWPLQFPNEMNAGGFDCLLCNPPWEKNKIQEQEWFAVRYPAIAEAAGATRRSYIDLLRQGKLTAHLNGQAEKEPNTADQALFRQYEAAQHLSHTTSLFYTAEGLRYPLTGKGDVNLYALFAETCFTLCKEDGRMGVLVPSGIATDDSTRAFFCELTEKRRLASLYDFENREKLFPAVDSRVRFSALTSAPSETVDMAFFLTNPRQLQDDKRHLAFKPTDFRMVNPNTGTTPIPRSRKDAELMLTIYRRVPVLQNEVTESNPWGIRFGSMFHMTNDSHLFMTAPTKSSLPLYEGKMIHHYDHRWATFITAGDKGEVRDVTEEEKADVHFEISPRYWVEAAEVHQKLADIAPNAKWLLAFRDIARATDMRTFISAFIPRTGVGNTLPLLFVSTEYTSKVACLQAAISSLIVDFIVRLKVGGTHMNFLQVKQIPVLPPNAYSEAAVAYITERVVKLTYTSDSMRPFAEDMGYKGDPIVFNEEERAVWRAELDAVFAKLYGLTKDELAYILDPTTFYGKEDCPTVTFPGLQDKEIKAYGEYRTQRLVLEAYDRVPDFSLPS